MIDRFGPWQKLASIAMAQDLLEKQDAMEYERIHSASSIVWVFVEEDDGDYLRVNESLETYPVAMKTYSFACQDGHNRLHWDLSLAICHETKELAWHLKKWVG